MAQDGDRASVGGAAVAGIILAVVAVLVIIYAARTAGPGSMAEQARRDNERVLAELDEKIARMRAEEAAVSVSREPKLRLGSWRCYSEHGYWYAAGRVTNISDSSLDSVTAVVTFETKDGQFVKNDQAMADYQPIMAGQTSPFTVITTGNPAISVCRLAFKHLMGAAIPFEK